jgi:hypothetical protein
LEIQRLVKTTSLPEKEKSVSRRMGALFLGRSLWFVLSGKTSEKVLRRKT